MTDDQTDSDQPAYFSDGIEPVARSWPGELFLIRIEARPDPDSEDSAEFGGAFVNCYIDADDLRTAERRAVGLIQADGWQPHRFDQWSLVTRDTYADCEPGDDGPDLREVVDEAFADGEVCVFNTYPVGDDNDDDGHQVECPEHGEQGIGLVCAHVAHAIDSGASAGFFFWDECDDGYARPDAWCRECEAALLAVPDGEPQDDWFEACDNKVLCAACWDLAKYRLYGSGPADND